MFENTMSPMEIDSYLIELGADLVALKNFVGAGDKDYLMYISKIELLEDVYNKIFPDNETDYWELITNKYEETYKQGGVTALYF